MLFQKVLEVVRKKWQEHLRFRLFMAEANLDRLVRKIQGNQYHLMELEKEWRLTVTKPEKERIRKEIEHWKDVTQYLVKEMAAWEEEIERLKGKLERMNRKVMAG